MATEENSGYLVPLFTCYHHFKSAGHIKAQDGDYMAYLFCCMEKILLTFTLTAIVLIAHQMFYVYMVKHQIRCADRRMVILIMCFIDTLYVFFHYGLMDPSYRSKVFPIIDCCRFLIMNSLCIYYCERASKLLAHRKQVLRFLIIWGTICLIIYIFIAIRIF